MFFYVLIILFFVLFIEAVSKNVEKKKLTGYCDFCFLKNILFLFMEQFFGPIRVDCSISNKSKSKRMGNIS